MSQRQAQPPRGHLGIGERLGEIRAHTKFNQAVFAQQIGASRSYLSQVERGQGKPSIEMIVGVARSFPDVSLTWLLTGIGPTGLTPPRHDLDRVRMLVAALETLAHDANRHMRHLSTFLEEGQR
jgi:transcriptional regulator with XRE-family HTH domain